MWFHAPFATQVSRFVAEATGTEADPSEREH